MGKMRNCGMRNAEGKMRNGMCGSTVIGHDVTARDRSHSAFNHTPCVECMEVKCILNRARVFCGMRIAECRKLSRRNLRKIKCGTFRKVPLVAFPQSAAEKFRISADRKTTCLLYTSPSPRD